MFFAVAVVQPGHVQHPGEGHHGCIREKIHRRQEGSGSKNRTNQAGGDGQKTGRQGHAKSHAQNEQKNGGAKGCESGSEDQADRQGGRRREGGAQGEAEKSDQKDQDAFGGQADAPARKIAASTGGTVSFLSSSELFGPGSGILFLLFIVQSYSLYHQKYQSWQ